MPSNSVSRRVELLIHRLMTEPEVVRAEMEAEIIKQYGPNYFTPEQLDAHWEAALVIIGFLPI